MRCRLSNGYSYSVEFAAESQVAFRAALRRAAFDYFAKLGKHARCELHVATDSGEWLSPRYPRSNAPVLLSHGQIASADFAQCVTSNRKGTWFEHEIAALVDFVAPT